MELLWIYGIFVLVNLAKTERFYITSNESTAVQASTLCTLATADILFSDKKLTIQLNSSDIENIGDHIGKGDTFWIGYTKIYAAFLYRGCTKKSDMQVISPKHDNIQPDPGVCYTFCKSTFIGVEGKRCYCLSMIPQSIQHNNCEQKCNQPSGTQCGRKNHYIAIYEVVEYHPVVTDNENGFCRAYDPVPKTYFWDSCSVEHSSLCTTVFNSTSSGHYTTTDNQEDWLAINNECLMNNEYPVNEQIPSLPNISASSVLWIGSIRSNMVTSIHETKQKQRLEQGYVKYGNNGFELKFNEQASIKRALCMTDAESTTSTPAHVSNATTAQHNLSSENPRTSNGVLSTKNSSTGQPEQTKESILSTGVTPTSDTTEPLSPEYSKGSTAKEEMNLVGVYVAIPLVLILIAVVVGFILRRQKRKQSVRKPNDKVAIRNGKKINNEIRNATSNAAYQDECPIGTKPETSEHNYHYLEPANVYSSIDDTVQTADENEYNTTNTGVVGRDVEANDSGNIYNRLDVELEDNYNHTNIASSRHEDTYSHTAVNNARDTICNLNAIARLPNGSPSDTYSHLEGTGMNGNTLPTNPNNSTTDVVDDTYNHTEGLILGTQQSSVNANVNSKLMPKFPDPKSRNYAYVTQTGQSGAYKPSSFTFNKAPGSGDYEFAKEPAVSGYELAKPTNIYLELQSDE